MANELRSAFWALRIGLGLGSFVAGLDKFFNVLTDWSMYLSPLAQKALPLAPTVLMRLVGVFELVMGLVILAGAARVGGYCAMAWLLAIATNLATMGMFYDLALRDVEISIGAYTLARLAEARRGVTPSEKLGRTQPNESKKGAKTMLEKKALAVFAVAVALPLTAAAETWKDVPVVDTSCLSKVKTDPDKHTTACALQCSKGGYGLIASDGTYLKFDAAGNEKTVAALKATKRVDHLRAVVVGERDGETIKVGSVTID